MSSDIDHNVLQRIEENLSEIEKAVMLIKQFNNNMEIKDEFILQSLKDAIDLAKSLGEIIKKQSLVKSQTNNNNEFILMTSICELLRISSPSDQGKLETQIKKIEAIYRILRE